MTVKLTTTITLTAAELLDVFQSGMVWASGGKGDEDTLINILQDILYERNCAQGMHGARPDEDFTRETFGFKRTKVNDL